MSQDGPKMAPKPKEVQDVCFGLAWAFILGYLGHSLALPSFCIRYFSCCYRYAIATATAMATATASANDFCSSLSLPFSVRVGGAPLSYKAS